MPAIVEVQKQLADMPDTLERLGGGIEKLSATLDGLLASLERLDQNVATLESSVKPLGRVADRLPIKNRS
jgi:archaellum component FlaC